MSKWRKSRIYSKENVRFEGVVFSDHSGYGYEIVKNSFRLFYKYCIYILGA